MSGLRRLYRYQVDNQGWSAWQTLYDFTQDFRVDAVTSTSGSVVHIEVQLTKIGTDKFHFVENWNGHEYVNCTDESSFPIQFAHDAHNGEPFFYEYELDPCNNVPDGQAVFVLLGRDSSGQLIAGQKNFDFTVGQHSFDFSAEVGQLGVDGSILGYLVRAAKGFTSGSIGISEYWNFLLSPPPIQTFAHNTYSISVPDASKSARILEQHYLVGFKEFMGVPLPVRFSTGKVEISCSFAALPECMDEVEPDVGGELENELGEVVLVEPEPPVPPNPPDPKPPRPKPDKPLPPDPVPPPDPIIPIPHDGPEVKVKPPKPDVEEPEIPEGCACEVYIGQCILSGSRAIVSGLHNLLFVGDVIQDITQKLKHLDERLEELIQSQNMIVEEINNQTNSEIEIGDQVSEAIVDSSSYLGDEVQDGLEEICETLEWVSEQEMLNLNGLLRLEPCEPDYPEGQTIIEVAKEFVDNYEPPLVEVLENEVVVNSDVDKVYSRDHF